jgi:hypothetical protein
MFKKANVDVLRLIGRYSSKDIFVSYSLVRTADGGLSVSVFQDKAGADESVKVARDWIGKNASNTGVGAPTVSEGTVIIHAK